MRANTHSIVVGKQPATKDGAGPRLLLALAMLALLQGCATGSPRASLTSGFGLHSRPSVSLHGSGPGLSAATPVLTEAQGGAGGFSSEPEALLAPFLACTSPGEFIRLQDTVDMPRLVEALDDWHAVRLGALGPVREDAAPLLNRKRASFLLRATENQGLAFAEVLVLFVLHSAHDDDVREVLLLLARDKQLGQTLGLMPVVREELRQRGLPLSAFAERDERAGDVLRGLGRAARDALASSLRPAPRATRAGATTSPTGTRASTSSRRARPPRGRCAGSPTR
jgi:hypothetical protein